jgi:hypothetical protein
VEDQSCELATLLNEKVGLNILANTSLAKIDKAIVKFEMVGNAQTTAVKLEKLKGN